MSAVARRASLDAGGWPAVATLARKELRTGLPLAFGALVVVAVLPLAAWPFGALDVFTTSWYREVALLVAAPLAAALLGGASVASERAESTLAFLSARAAAPSEVRGVKFTVHFVLALGAFGGCAALVQLWPGSRQAAWLESFDLPAVAVSGLGLLLCVAVFMLAFAGSCFLGDPLTAALGGGLAGAAWVILAGYAPAAVIAHSAETGVHSAVMLFAPLVAGPTALATWLVFREDVSRWESEGRARLAAWLMLAIAVAPWALAPWGLGLARDQRALALGRGVVASSPLLLSPNGSAVAFVAHPPRDPSAKPLASVHGRAVIAFMGRRDADAFPTVLPWGTRPVAWTSRGNELVVDWPGGTRRVVDFGGTTRPPDTEEKALAVAGNNTALRVQEGRLILSRDGAELTLFPLAPEERVP